ncbi:MAG: hypothetical protein A2534_03270 [Candidatus Magasanikbacteria bacterium RIFOXYD2_FULL_39_9]|uniref:BioF2-like acetyltransferase domain-containing protein n=1 Tax=Candidatus Magasanikbacteria bacterium RIFOXYD1_FULL_40_23 TaxID=1798705 RepID=A0A1F6PAP8_9BACT|nr:MAG: hypothetical protein A2534_03270 [Candidatus Magasanikbacteria bacterium RIFOXYD2_FULL_39_9]OGH93110.1 MAG: hypothetical protein A2563_00275 [Candidatus Magasanikbacteria bacterium RIFOXYD1_FULL_40_23]
MEIKIIQNKEEWDGWFLRGQGTSNFLQSWAWGDVLIAEGKNVERLAVVEGGRVLAQAQLIYTPIFFGWQYAFCPKGPTSDESGSKNQEVRIYETIANFLKEKNVIFFRTEPSSIIHNSSFMLQKSIDINPSATLILGLNKTEDQLLAGMHSKTRYNIHLAEKKNLKISQDKNLEVFWGLMNKTGSRDKFGLHHKEHYAKVLQSPIINQLTAYEDKNAVACAVFVRFGNTFTYLYGASDYEYRNLMAPYLLQWEGVKMGKSFGCKEYDFFGVAPSKNLENRIQKIEYNYDLKHQYAGVTRFKLGFGGAPRQAPGTFDLLINKNKYIIYNILRRLRRLF